MDHDWLGVVWSPRKEKKWKWGTIMGDPHPGQVMKNKHLEPPNQDPPMCHMGLSENNTPKSTGLDIILISFPPSMAILWLDNIPFLGKATRKLLEKGTPKSSGIGHRLTGTQWFCGSHLVFDMSLEIWIKLYVHIYIYTMAEQNCGTYNIYACLLCNMDPGSWLLKAAEVSPVPWVPGSAHLHRSSTRHGA